MRLAAATLASALLIQACPAMAADDRLTVARKFGEAFAIAERCPALAANLDRMGTASAALGIEIDGGFKAVMMVWKNRTLTELSGVSEVDVCNLGRWRYGAAGTEGPRLLVEN